MSASFILFYCSCVHFPTGRGGLPVCRCHRTCPANFHRCANPIVVQACDGITSGTAGVCKNGDGLCLPFANADAEECSSGAQPCPARPAPPVLCPNLLLDLAAMVWGEKDRGYTW